MYDFEPVQLIKDIEAQIGEYSGQADRLAEGGFGKIKRKHRESLTEQGWQTYDILTRAKRLLLVSGGYSIDAFDENGVFKREATDEPGRANPMSAERDRADLERLAVVHSKIERILAERIEIKHRMAELAARKAA